MAILGPQYSEFISAETGEWGHEKDVLARFSEMFEYRIRLLFNALDGETPDDVMSLKSAKTPNNNNS